MNSGLGGAIGLSFFANFEVMHEFAHSVGTLIGVTFRKQKCQLFILSDSIFASSWVLSGRGAQVHNYFSSDQRICLQRLHVTLSIGNLHLAPDGGALVAGPPQTWPGNHLQVTSYPHLITE